MKSWDCDVKPALEHMSFSVLIPARLASSRLPNKPLADINGVPMVVRVAQRASMSGALNVVVACTGTEKFGNAQIATIQKKIKN